MKNLLSKSAVSKMIAVVIAIIIIVAAIAGAYYYSTLPSPSPPPTTVKNTLVIAMPADAAAIDPGTMQVDNTGFSVISDMYEGLINHVWQPSADGKYLAMNTTQFEGRVAESWVHSADYKTWTFYLRRGLTFHSGNLLTANEVVWSFVNYHFLLPTGSVVAMAGATPDGVKALDNYTVQFTLANSNSEFLQYICQAATGVIMDEQLILQHGGVTANTRNPWLAINDAGSGPYKLDHWTPGVEIVLTAFNNYWRTGYPKTPKIVFRIIPDVATQEMALASGDVDIIYNLPSKDIARMQATQNVTVVSAPSADTFFIELRTENETGFAVPEFTNPLVREALRYTMPYDDINSQIQYGYAQRLGSIVPPTFPDYVDVYTSKYNYNLTRAKELLTEAGYPNGFELTLTLGVGMESAQEEVMIAWQSELAKIGVTMKMELLPAATFNALMQGHKLNMWVVDWSSYTSDPYYQLFWFITSDVKLAGFSGNPCDFVDMAKDPNLHPGLQAHWLAGLYEPNATLRSIIAQNLQQEAIDKSYHILIYSAGVNIAMRSNVHDYWVHLENAVHPQTVYELTS
jgi:peptide/nickel transport system substrate-binding protein